VERLLQDLRFSIRDLLTRPGFTAVAVLTLAIAIGANTAMFSIVNATLLRPLPFAQPDRLMAIHLMVPKNAEAMARLGRQEMVWSYPKFAAFRAARHAFSDLALYEQNEMSLTGREQPERLTGEAVGAAYFQTLGVVPAAGRGFLREEDSQPGTRTVVVLGHSLWTRQFAADPKVVGTLVKLDGQSFTVVGVAPLLRALLYGVTPTDPATFISVAAVLAAVATMASIVPAGRAMRINPLVAIRRQ
jgi:putative ABC transport system permease protein